MVEGEHKVGKDKFQGSGNFPPGAVFTACSYRRPTLGASSHKVPPSYGCHHPSTPILHKFTYGEKGLLKGTNTLRYELIGLGMYNVHQVLWLCQVHIKFS